MWTRRGDARPRRSNGAAARAAGLAAALSLAVGSAACGGLFRHYDVAPNGLERTDYDLRRLLSEQSYDTALARVRSDRYAPKDELLRQLYVGLIAHYAGDHKQAARALERAASLADDRYTKSISRSVLSLVTSDYALKYEPSTTERLLLPFYAALDYIDAEDPAGAAVEARRIAGLLERARDDGRAVDPALVRFLRYFSGAVFEAAGDRNDADVAYRNALRGDATDTTPAAEAPRLIGRAAADSGDVVVLVERGFVAHRIEQGLVVALGDGEVTALAAGSTDDRYLTATGIASRVLDEHAADGAEGMLFVDRMGRRYDPCNDAWRTNLADAAADSAQPDTARAVPPTPVLDLTAAGDAPTASLGPGRCNGFRSHPGDIDYLLHIAWPAYRVTAAPSLVPRIASDAGADVAAATLGVDVSSAVVDDFRRELPILLARTVARASTKYALTRALKTEVSKKDEDLGEIVGVLGDAVAVLTERADTRSWTLLPAGISIVRLRLSAGTHSLWLQPDGSLTDAHETPADASAAPGRHELGTVHVPGGGVAIVSTRLWR